MTVLKTPKTVSPAKKARRRARIDSNWGLFKKVYLSVKWFLFGYPTVEVTEEAISKWVNEFTLTYVDSNGALQTWQCHHEDPRELHKMLKKVSEQVSDSIANQVNAIILE